MAVTLSIIVPTLCRATLPAALRSIASQLGPRDEVLLIADPAGDVDAVRRLVTDVLGPFSDCRWRYSEIKSDGTGPGYAQRNYAMLLAGGTHLAFMDDDDVYVPGALNAMRRNASPTRPAIFRMRHPLLGLLWRDERLVFGNVSSQMLLVPNRPAKLGEWAPHTDGVGGDFTFITGCVQKMGAPVWCKAVVAEISPAGIAAGSRAAGAVA